MSNKSHRDEVKFFNICVDDFFENPDKIVDFANKLEYYPDKKGAWPGVRSVPLHEIDRDLNTDLVSKIFRAHYPGGKNYLSYYDSVICFAKTKSYNNKFLNEGWIHVDYPSVIAGLVYLTPNANLEGGTNIYQIKNEFKDTFNDEIPQEQKILFYTNSPDFDLNTYKKELEETNKNFNLVTKFNNVYNRMIMWSGTEYHGANSFEGFEEEERLTLNFFLNKVGVNDSLQPHDYIKELDENIESKIKSIG